MKSIFVLISFLCFCIGFSQEFSGMMSLKLKKEDKSYTSVDHNKSNVVVCFENDRKIKAILLDSKTTFIDSLRAIPMATNRKFIAENTLNKVTKIVYTNDDFTSFLIQKFDFNLKIESSQKVLFNSNDKKILQIFFNNNILYVVSISKYDKSLIITSITDNNTVSENKIEEKFINLYDYAYSIEKQKFPLILIKENEFNSFAVTKSVSKCYLINDMFLISLDKNQIETEIISINLKNNTASNNFIKRENSVNVISYNSILIGDKIAQVEQNSDRYYLTIKDLEGTILKKYSEDELKKSKFFTEVELGKIEEIENKKYFKKVNIKELGINYTKRNDIVYLNIGSLTNARMPKNDEQGSSYAQIGLIVGGVVGGLIGALIDNNESSINVDNFSEHFANGQTFTQLQLDSSLNALETSKKDFSHTKLKKQIINSNSFTNPNIFFFNDLYYLGYYNSKEKRYFFKKFDD
ncbi:hypothetical protein [Flavobacterium sp.]|uniref:hypothetical protein n=1 Tax=Flavobacterium sp. TaxID=239 RepID=UPI0037508423